LNEPELIARYFAPLAGPGGLGLRDDAALLAPPPGTELVLTADALVAGRHFFAEDPPADIAAKALGVNLSDLAAKGADPLGFLLTLALPPDWRAEWLGNFAKGLGEASQAAGCQLLGGDTVATPGPLTLSITALGAVPQGKMIRRAGAKPGDALFVTGTIGDAALGLKIRQAEVSGDPLPDWAQKLAPADRAFLVGRYLRPQPRLAAIPGLRAAASAAMDVSDGLVGDLRALLRASSVSGRIELADIPLSQAARAALDADPSLEETIFCGGDDYEILCAAPEAAASMLAGFATRIGCCGAPVAPDLFVGADGREKMFSRDRFSHF
jgi:thiamine-monophosphate kinase